MQRRARVRLSGRRFSHLVHLVNAHALATVVEFQVRREAAVGLGKGPNFFGLQLLRLRNEGAALGHASVCHKQPEACSRRCEDALKKNTKYHPNM